MEFVENALATFADHHAQPSLLLDELSMHKRDSNGFFSTRVVCRSSDTSHNSTTGYVAIDYKLLGFLCAACTRGRGCRHVAFTCTPVYALKAGYYWGSLGGFN